MGLDKNCICPFQSELKQHPISQIGHSAAKPIRFEIVVMGAAVNKAFAKSLAEHSQQPQVHAGSARVVHIRLGTPQRQRLEHGLTRLGRDKVENRRRAAAGRGYGPGPKAVRADAAGQRQLQMDVGIDAAGAHVAAGRVDGSPAAQILANGGNRLALDGEIGGEASAAGDQLAVLDDESVHGGRFAFCNYIDNVTFGLKGAIEA